MSQPSKVDFCVTFLNSGPFFYFCQIKRINLLAGSDDPDLFSSYSYVQVEPKGTVQTCNFHHMGTVPMFHLSQANTNLEWVRQNSNPKNVWDIIKLLKVPWYSKQTDGERRAAKATPSINQEEFFFWAISSSFLGLGFWRMKWCVKETFYIRQI